MNVEGDRQYAAILLSRQPRRPCRADEWVRQTEQAVLWLKESGQEIVSSVGLPTWELITSLASIHRLPLRLIVPVPSSEYADEIAADIAQQFDLRAALTEIIPLIAEGGTGRKQVMLRRDEATVKTADILLPVSMRTGGRMAALVGTATAEGKPIDRRFEIEYRVRRDKLAYAIDQSRINPQLSSFAPEYLIHWTRAANGPWPGEKAIDYYKDVLASDRYLRTGFDTLRRTLQMKRLIASPRHMPQNTPVVAFSGLSPLEVAPLMRWRARFGEMSFEPYGIGIKVDAALRAATQPVRYYDRKIKGEVSGQPWLWQSTGTRTDWRQEREYRHPGDFDLDKLLPSDLLVFCLTSDEAAEITANFGLRAVSFY
jgi:hypothetical protein